MRWYYWIEPFGPNNEPMFCCVPEDTAIAYARAGALAQGFDYDQYGEDGDALALDNFVVVHWATELPEGERIFNAKETRKRTEEASKEETS